MCAARRGAGARSVTVGSRGAPRAQCSEVTARLVVDVLGVQPQWVQGHPWHTPFALVPGLDATLLPANHCPGASLDLLLADPARVTVVG
jgi:Cft2 family RNA processing exonuclease